MVLDSYRRKKTLKTSIYKGLCMVYWAGLDNILAEEVSAEYKSTQVTLP